MQLTARLTDRAPESKSIPMPVYLFYFAAGMAPISALALTVFEWWSLPVGTVALVLPALVGSIALAILHPSAGRLACQGFGMGLIAVTVYDGTRLPFILAGVWGDFIPKIGGWLLNQPEPNWVLGYLWRYLGNGGSMGMAFTMLYVGWLTTQRPTPSSRLRYSVQRRRQRAGAPSTLPTSRHRYTLIAALGFGLLVWGCLLLTLLLSPHGETLLFELTPLSFGLSLLGHVVFGAVLGGLLQRLSIER